MVRYFAATLALTGLSAVVAMPARAVDPNADVVYVRKACGTMSNCFTTMASLQSWVWGTRHPSATSPLLVDIGPGDFDQFECPSATPANGHVTFRGSGRDQTRITGGDSSTHGAITATACDKLSFQDLTIAGNNFGVVWTGAGSSQWSNVEVGATTTLGVFAYGWYEFAAPCTTKAKHDWFGSKIVTTGSGFVNVGYYAKCSENRFYGGEIESNMSHYAGSTTAFLTISNAIRLESDAEFYAFGSELRTRFGPFCGTVSSLEAIQLSGNTEFQSMGGLIESTGVAEDYTCGSTPNQSATDISAAGNGFAYTPGTAFLVSASGTGVASRLIKQGTARVDAPFQWPAATDPPVVVSTTGADMFIETDCDGAGNCNGSGTETHLMIYNPVRCPASKWFNSTKASCRP